MLTEAIACSLSQDPQGWSHVPIGGPTCFVSAVQPVWLSAVITQDVGFVGNGEAGKGGRRNTGLKKEIGADPQGQG